MSTEPRLETWASIVLQAAGLTFGVFSQITDEDVGHVTLLYTGILMFICRSILFVFSVSSFDLTSGTGA